MADIGFLLLLTGFFALCVAFVRGCERIIGPDPDDFEPVGTEVSARAEPAEEAVPA